MTTLLGSEAVGCGVDGKSRPEQTAAGTVVDVRGKPIEGVKIVLYAPPTRNFTGDPAEAKALSDSDGKFRFKVPPLSRIRVRTNDVNVWAFRPGLAIAAVPYEPSKLHQIGLQNSESRTVKVEAPDGKPVAGARVEARLIHFTGGTGGAEIPASMASPIAVTTGSDGTATLTYLRARDRLLAARVTADSIGEQDLPVGEETRQGFAGPIFAIKLKKTSRLSGRIVDAAGRGVAGQTVEIWSLGAGRSSVPSLVVFRNGPVRTGADGAFQTPDNLMIGSSLSRRRSSQAWQGADHLRLARNHRAAVDARTDRAAGISLDQRPCDRPARESRRQRPGVSIGQWIGSDHRQHRSRWPGSH